MMLNYLACDMCCVRQHVHREVPDGTLVDNTMKALSVVFVIHWGLCFLVLNLSKASAQVSNIIWQRLTLLIFMNVKIWLIIICK